MEGKGGQGGQTTMPSAGGVDQVVCRDGSSCQWASGGQCPAFVCPKRPKPSDAQRKNLHSQEAWRWSNT